MNDYDEPILLFGLLSALIWLILIVGSVSLVYLAFSILT